MAEPGAPGEQAPQGPGDWVEMGSAEIEMGSAEIQPPPDERTGRKDGGAETAHPSGGHRLGDPWNEVMHLADQVAAARTIVPAWRRRTRGERRWPVTASVVAAIVLQILLADALNKPLPHYLLPGLEVALGVGLSIANPVRIQRTGPLLRAASIALIVLITAANAGSAVLLVHAILFEPKITSNATPLLASGASIWATNVIAFGLWYWEFDRGGPVERALGGGNMRPPDFLFPQMGLKQDLVPTNWEPHFIDYLYLSFTNATAFSPTDVMPLARWSKCTMAVQSAVALLVGVLVIARAVNILQ
jgi:hypothetical protein